MKTILRRLKKSDAASYRRLRIAGLRESPTAFGASYAQESKMPIEFFADRIENTGDRWVLGAFGDKKLIGVVGFVRDLGLKTRHKGFIWGMYVSPSFRSCGIGTTLFNEMLHLIEGLPRLRWVRLSVTTSNESALQLYKKFGFVAYGEEPEALLVGKNYYSEYHMIRRIKSVPRDSSKPTANRTAK